MEGKMGEEKKPEKQADLPNEQKPKSIQIVKQPGAGGSPSWPQTEVNKKRNPHKEAWPGAGFNLDWANAEEADFEIIEQQLEKLFDTQAKIHFLDRISIEFKSYEADRQKADQLKRHGYVRDRASRFHEKCRAEARKLTRLMQLERAMQKVELLRNKQAPGDAEPFDFQALLRGIERGEASPQAACQALRGAKGSHSGDERIKQLRQAFRTQAESLRSAKETAQAKGLGKVGRSISSR